MEAYIAMRYKQIRKCWQQLRSFILVKSYFNNRRKPNLDGSNKIGFILNCSVYDLLVDNKNLKLKWHYKRIKRHRTRHSILLKQSLFNLETVVVQCCIFIQLAFNF